jgi:uncharacterized protein (TIGR03437 family)
MQVLKLCRRLFPFLAAVVCLAQPRVFYVENAASNMPQGFPNPGISKNPSFPNAGIAQGAMFVVKGNNLGPAAIVIAASFPLQTTLAGTSVQVTVGGQTVNTIMYYTQAQQVATILPSNTPPGTGTLTVTYNGQSSSAPVVVVQNGVAMYTINQDGTGDAVATLPNNSVVFPDNAPNPGQVVTFWANGLGPVSYDETKPALGGDMTSVPLEVFIGGRQAAVLYHGRNSCCVSEDQINVQIPQGVTGCVVSVIMKIGNFISNTTTIPIATTGRVCTPTNTAISTSDVQSVLGQGTLRLGRVSLERGIAGPIPGPDTGSAIFQQLSGLPSLLLDSIVDIPSSGSCIVYYSASLVAGGGIVAKDPALDLTYQGLDAGSSLSVTGPNGTKTFERSFPPLDQSGTYLDPGKYTITGNGGSDVAGFSASLSIPSPQFAWTNQGQITSVDRTKGVTVNWTGGDPSGYVKIIGYVYPDPYDTAWFTCYARVPDGSFTVPPSVLLAIPTSASNSPSHIQDSLGVIATSLPVQFRAGGLDLGIASSDVNASTVDVTYQ